MLLFMLHAQLYQSRDRGLQWFLQQTAHGLVHMRADTPSPLSHRRATQAPSLRACQVSALRFVVAVEQVAIQRMEQSIVRLLFREDKSLEEPRGVGQVPLRRTDVGNRLGNMVLGTSEGHTAVRCANGQRRIGLGGCLQVSRQMRKRESTSEALGADGDLGHI